MRAVNARIGARRARSITVLAVVVLLGSAAVAYAYTNVRLRRCGDVPAEYGTSGVYPWHISCAAAKQVITGSDAKGARTIALTAPGTDGAAVKIAGKYWVCTGQMGYYNCGYPYRPLKTKTGTAYAGPFTEDVDFITCSLHAGKVCPASTVAALPSK
jgi:hypothetical protein